MNTNQIQPAHPQMQDHYLAKVNALVAADREDLIVDITTEYAALVEANAEPDEQAAA